MLSIGFQTPLKQMSLRPVPGFLMDFQHGNGRLACTIANWSSNFYKREKEKIMGKKFLLSFSSFNGVDCNIGRFFVLVVPELSQFEMPYRIYRKERHSVFCVVIVGLFD